MKKLVAIFVQNVRYCKCLVVTYTQRKPQPFSLSAVTKTKLMPLLSLCVMLFNALQPTCCSRQHCCNTQWAWRGMAQTPTPHMRHKGVTRLADTPTKLVYMTQLPGIHKPLSEPSHRASLRANNAVATSISHCHYTYKYIYSCGHIASRLLWAVLEQPYHFQDDTDLSGAPHAPQDVLLAAFYGSISGSVPFRAHQVGPRAGITSTVATISNSTSRWNRNKMSGQGSSRLRGALQVYKPIQAG